MNHFLKTAQLDSFRNGRNGWRSPITGWRVEVLLVGVLILLAWGLSGCGVSPVDAEDRLFVPLAVEVLDEFVLPSTLEFEGTPVGGVSAIAYDRRGDRFYALADDRSQLAPARFYELKLKLDQESIESVKVKNVVTLKDKENQPFEAGEIDPEGIVLTPRGTVIISSEGDSLKGINPFIGEFNLDTGQLISTLPLPSRYLPQIDPERSKVITEGIRNNLGFESLTTEANGAVRSPVEPFRIFTAVESALAQDVDKDLPKLEQAKKVRWLHYSLSIGQPFLISEHLYELEPRPKDAVMQGLSEILTLDAGGRFLALERSFSPESGFGIKLYEVALGAATDTAAYETLRGDLEGVVAPARKRLLLDLNTTDLDLDNLEGMAIGPRLADGSYSLVLVSDNNFNTFQKTQFILLKLSGYEPG